MKDSINKSIRNCFKLEKETKLKRKKETKDDAINSIRSLFKLEKETEPIKEKTIIRGIRNLEEQDDDYYKPIRADNFYSSDYIEHESNDEILPKIRIKYEQSIQKVITLKLWLMVIQMKLLKKFLIRLFLDINLFYKLK